MVMNRDHIIQMVIERQTQIKVQLDVIQRLALILDRTIKNLQHDEEVNNEFNRSGL